jgi:RNA polymerase sigma-70 factor, ECF subfamily
VHDRGVRECRRRLEPIRLEERRLVRALRNGDESAYAELHALYDARLVSLAISHGCSRAVAQEVVQDTWASVARSIHTFQGRSTLKTWIFRILVNAANARVKRERRVVPLAVIETPGTAATPHDQVVWKELLARMRAAIERLSPAQRKVIVLRDIQGLSSEEVCDHLAISEINQRVLLHRARSSVRHELAGYLDGDTRTLPQAA